MRILVSSDLHYRLPHYDWLLSQAEHYDAVALPGDHLDIVGTVPLEAQIVVLTGYLQRLAGRTLLVTTSGNHDLDGPGEAGEQIAGWLQRLRNGGLHVDGERVDSDGTRFTLCPWWDGPETKTQVEALLARDAENRPTRWIWLYHSPPGGTGLCRTSRKEFPDHDLAAWIGRWQPDLVFCGHVHQAPWVTGGGWAARMGRTWVFNAGRQIGPVPAHVVIDTEAGRASWHGIPEQDEVSLD